MKLTRLTNTIINTYTDFYEVDVTLTLYTTRADEMHQFMSMLDDCLRKGLPVQPILKKELIYQMGKEISSLLALKHALGTEIRELKTKSAYNDELTAKLEEIYTIVENFRPDENDHYHSCEHEEDDE